MQHELSDVYNLDNGADNCTSHWSFSPVFGIVHIKNCPVCRAYMMHIAVANQSGNISFKDALNDRTNSTSTVTAFLDGVESGRQLQEEHYTPVLDSYRGERDKALHSLKQNEKMLDAAKKEIQALQDLVSALRAAQDATTSNNEVPNLSVVKSPATSDGLSLIDRFLSNASTDDLSTPASSKQSLPDLSITIGDIVEIQPSTHRRDSLRICKTPSPFLPSTSVLSSTDPPRGTNTLNTKSQPHKSTPSVPLKPLRPASPSLSIQRPPSVPAQTAKARALSPPTTVSQLQPLMTAPRIGDGCVFRTEIYVDASQWGIGFAMNGSWLAWKFSNSLALSSNSQFDINWAEMLAVEVGLWTVIHWIYVILQKGRERFDSMELMVRCDNAGVVKAIEKRHSGFQPQQDILRRILDIADEYDIELAVKWVPSMDNPADNPSRGVPSAGTTRLPFIPLLPSYLCDTLNIISTDLTTH